MHKLSRTRTLLLIQIVFVLLLGATTFQVSKVFAYGYSYASLGYSTPVLRGGSALPGGRPYHVIPHMALEEERGSAGQTQFRLFNIAMGDVWWEQPELTWMRDHRDGNRYMMIFHIFNGNSNCYRSNVTESHDSQGQRLNGSACGTDIPNAWPDGDVKKNAKCGNQGDSWERNEIRFEIYGNNTNAITPNRNYFVSASFVDYNWPSSRAWIEASYGFYRIFGVFDSETQKADYGNKSARL